jgi:periplasmic protein TonB
MNNADTYGESLPNQPGSSFSTALAVRSDYLGIMLFIAALLHGVLILGVTFTADAPVKSTVDTAAMEVVLLNREYEKRPDRDDAAYLAKQNLAGAGNTNEDAALRVAYGRNKEPAMPGPEREGTDTLSRQVTKQQSSQELLYARTREGGLAAERSGRESSETLLMRTGMPGNANSVEVIATPDAETVLKGAQPRQLLISANTRESRIAAYLDDWKRRVERVGTINFPFAALDQPGIRNPVLEVTIAADGKLTEVIILTGSGSQELDAATVNILKMAAPFDQFPEYLRSDYDELKFSYEWQFTGSSVGRITVP